MENVGAGVQLTWGTLALQLLWSNSLGIKILLIGEAEGSAIYQTQKPRQFWAEKTLAQRCKAAELGGKDLQGCSLQTAQGTHLLSLTLLHASKNLAGSPY